MRLVLRILFLIPVAYAAACVAAGIVVAVGGYHDLAAQPEAGINGWIITFAVVLGAFFGAFAALPALVAIVLAEVLRWRAFSYFVAVGGIIALAAEIRMRNWGESVLIEKPPLLLASGFVAGAVYWLVAGRTSGMTEPEPRRADSG